MSTETYDRGGVALVAALALLAATAALLGLRPVVALAGIGSIVVGLVLLAWRPTDR